MTVTESTTIEFWCTYGGSHSVVGEVWYRWASAHGISAERYSRYMCEALTMMAHTPTDCDEIIERIDAVASGEVAENSYGLNDTSVTFRQGGAQVNISIEDEKNVPEAQFGLGEYRKVVYAWREFLLMPGGEQSRLKLELQT